MLTQHIDFEKFKIALVKIVNAQDFENTIQSLKGLSPIFFQNTHAFFSGRSSTQYKDICDQVCSEATKAGIYPTETLQKHCSRIYSLAAECHAARIAELEQEHQRMACEAAQIRFENYRFDEQPDITLRSQALLDALSNLTNLDIKDSREIEHLTLLLTTKRDALTSSILAAQAKFDAYQFDSQPTVNAQFQSIVVTLSNIHALATLNTLEFSDADEFAHLCALLIRERDTIETAISAAETQYKTVMDAVNSESVVSRRLQAISQALHNPPATLTPMATRHYHALLADEHQALESSMTSAQARFKRACSAGAKPGKASLGGKQTINKRLENMISTLANLPKLAIEDANEASHLEMLLTLERDRLQQDIDAAEAHFQRDRERFNAEPVVAKRFQIIEQTIRNAQSTQLIAQHHYRALLTKERKTLVESMQTAEARFNHYPFTTFTSQTLETALQAVNTALDAVHTLGIVDVNELAHLSALLKAEKEALQTHIRSAEIQHQAAMACFNAEPIVAKRLQAISEALRTLPSTLAFKAKRHYHVLLTAEHSALAASMAAAQTRFESYNFRDPKKTVNERLTNLVATLANIADIPITDPNEAAHFSTLVTTQRDQYQRFIDEAEAHFQRDWERFNTQPVMATRLQIIDQTIRDARSTRLIAQHHYRSLLIKERSALAASMAAAQTRFNQYPFARAFARGSWEDRYFGHLGDRTVDGTFQAIATALANVNTLAIADPNELAHLSALLASARDALQTHISAAEAEYQAAMTRFNAEPVVAKRLQAISQAINTTSYSYWSFAWTRNPNPTPPNPNLTPIAKQHYIALLKAAERPLQASVVAAQTRLGTYRLNDPLTTVNDRLAKVVSTLADIPSLAIVDPNEAAHFTALLTSEKSRLQHCLDVKTAEARFQSDRDRFNAEPSMTTRLTAIDETIRTADAQGLAAKQHYLSLLTAERQALNTSIAAAQEKFNQYLFANQPDIKARHQTVVVTLSETRLQPVLPDPNANAHLTELLSKERDILQAQKEQQELLLIQQAAEKERFLLQKAETGLLLSPEEIQRYNITNADKGRYCLMVAATIGS